jgi:hypothetical protein
MRLSMVENGARGEATVRVDADADADDE